MRLHFTCHVVFFYLKIWSIADGPVAQLPLAAIGPLKLAKPEGCRANVAAPAAQLFLYRIESIFLMQKSGTKSLFVSAEATNSVLQPVR